MIHAEISIPPHYKECRWIEPLKFDPETPPHVIFAMKFKTWAEAKEVLVDQLKLKTDSDSLGSLLTENEDNVYVGVELDLLDQTGKLYTEAVLGIEGEEE